MSELIEKRSLIFLKAVKSSSLIAAFFLKLVMLTLDAPRYNLEITGLYDNSKLSVI